MDEAACTTVPYRVALLAASTLLLLASLVMTGVASNGNSPPTAVITSPADGTTVLVGATLTFDGSSSYDDDLPNLTYEWNFSGVIVTGKDMAVVQHTFLSPGDMVVVLKVIDSGGLESKAFVSIKVRAENRPPVAVISSPSEGEAFLNGRSISFDGSLSSDPEGGALVFRWETNRTIDPIGDRAKFPLKLPLGRYRVTLYVFDQLGATGMATVNISVVTGVPPELSGGDVSPTLGPEDLQGGFNFTVTYSDADNDPPTEILVKVGPAGALQDHAMAPTYPDDTDYRDGREYHARVQLAPGPHMYVFSCRDRFYACATVLLEGPLVYRVEVLDLPDIDAVATINWTQLGSVSGQRVPSPGPGPSDVVRLSSPVRVVISGGEWSQARLELTYEVGYVTDPDTITLLWYDPSRGLWVPASGQHHNGTLHSVEGSLPGPDTVLAVFGQLSSSSQNNPPELVIKYNVRKAYVGEPIWFDASSSSDPDGTVLLFYWDFVEDGEPGPWIAGVTAYHVYSKAGIHEVVLLAVDGQNEHTLHLNVSVREEEEVSPGPWDNPGALFLLASLMVIAFGLAVAYRLHKPKTYDDLFGKAYKAQEEDEYSQLFRKLTEVELRGDGPDEGDSPPDGAGGKGAVGNVSDEHAKDETEALEEQAGGEQADEEHLERGQAGGGD